MKPIISSTGEAPLSRPQNGLEIPGLLQHIFRWLSVAPGYETWADEGRCLKCGELVEGDWDVCGRHG